MIGLMNAVRKPPPKRVCLYYNAGLAKTVGNTVAARSYSGPVLGETDKYHGDLKDQDRIFTNLYGKQDVYLKGALSRVRL